MRILVIFLCVLFSPGIRGQILPKPTYTLTTRMHYGFIWNFSKEVAHLSNQHMPAFELNLTKQTKGGKSWQQEYRYPQVGYSLYYFVFDSKKPVGNALAVLVHAGKNFCKTKRFNAQWRLGFGMAYVEKRYNVETNFKNNVISERINFTLNGQANFNYTISKRVVVNLGVGLTHISNGALKRPNFGINLPTIYAGLGVNLNQDKEERLRDTTYLFKRKTYFHISPFMGLKETYPVNGPKYFLGGINAYAERRMNRKSGLNLGVDFSYDHSKKSEIIQDTLNVKNIFLNRSQAAIIAGHELYINKLSLITQMGVYVYDPTHLNKSFYQKVGFKYYVSERLFVGIAMKLHLGVADWIEWGGGIRI